MRKTVRWQLSKVKMKRENRYDITFNFNHTIYLLHHLHEAFSIKKLNILCQPLRMLRDLLILKNHPIRNQSRFKGSKRSKQFIFGGHAAWLRTGGYEPINQWVAPVPSSGIVPSSQGRPCVPCVPGPGDEQHLDNWIRAPALHLTSDIGNRENN